ncbi:MAG: hypothetical protein MJ252_23155 [archaeon]|nr:hypothetical protein [archaeon]
MTSENSPGYERRFAELFEERTKEYKILRGLAISKPALLKNLPNTFSKPSLKNYGIKIDGDDKSSGKEESKKIEDIKEIKFFKEDFLPPGDLESFIRAALSSKKINFKDYFGETEPIVKLIYDLCNAVYMIGEQGYIIRNLTAKNVFLRIPPDKINEYREAEKKKGNAKKDKNDTKNKIIFEVFKSSNMNAVIFDLTKALSFKGSKYVKKTAANQLTSDELTALYPYGSPDLGEELLDTRSDVFSVGCIAFWLLTGVHYSSGYGYHKVPKSSTQLNSFSNEKAEVFNQLSLSDSAIEFLGKCLKEDRRQRPFMKDILNLDFFKDINQCANRKKDTYLSWSSKTLLGKFNALREAVKNYDTGVLKMDPVPEDPKEKSVEAEATSSYSKRFGRGGIKRAPSEVLKDDYLKDFNEMNGLESKGVLKDEYEKFGEPIDLLLEPMPKESFYEFEDWEIGF